MPYLSTDKTKVIREQIKREFPGYKFSVTNDNYSGVSIVILEAPIPLEEGSVNTHWLKDHYKDKPAELKLYSRLVEIAQQFIKPGDGHHDADYGFVPSYYVWLKVGEYGKPFKVVQNIEAEHKEIVRVVEKNLNDKKGLKKIKALWNSRCAETKKIIAKGEDMYYDYVAKKCYCMESNMAKSMEPVAKMKIEEVKALQCFPPAGLTEMEFSEKIFSKEAPQEAFPNAFTMKEDFYCLN